MFDQCAALQAWKDKRLSWKPAEYGGITNVYAKCEMLWTPDIFLINE